MCFCDGQWSFYSLDAVSHEAMTALTSLGVDVEAALDYGNFAEIGGSHVRGSRTNTSMNW